jgi:uncharacterized protein YjbI with pentapeptide repeats
MANPEHLEILRQGVEVWNKWRKEDELLSPDLSAAKLPRAYLVEANLSRVNLSGASLRWADLSGANLRRANLGGATLRSAILNGALLRMATLSNVTFREASLQMAYLGKANLKGANLTRANLQHANLSEVNSRGTDFSEADLRGVNLQGALMSGASFRGADLTSVNLSNADLDDTDFKDAKMGWATFGNNDLSSVKGLEYVIHYGPSTVGLDTLYRSGGKVSRRFLRGCGVPENIISYIPALVAAPEPIQFYSCFISYSSGDQDFAERLHADLQAKGVRVWFAPRDMKIGAKIRPAIDESIRVYDKLLLVLSEHSVSSQWVEQEVETAFRKERQDGEGTALFPVRLDDSVFDVGEGWPALIKDTRHVGDFTDWKDHDSYRKAFDRLLRDLKAET